MKMLMEWFQHSGSLHHAYLLQGEKETIRQKLFAFLEKHIEHPVQGNPDFWHECFDVFTIDDARKLKELQTTRPLAYPRKIFVLETTGMTVEAQNALLKVFEEPSPETHFFLIAPSADVFLPTLRSRMVIIAECAAANSSRAKTFLELSVPERLAYLAPIIEEKDRGAACELVDNLISEISRKKESRIPSLIHELFVQRAYLNDRAPSLKLILEHIALIM